LTIGFTQSLAIAWIASTLVFVTLIVFLKLHYAKRQVTVK